MGKIDVLKAAAEGNVDQVISYVAEGGRWDVRDEVIVIVLVIVLGLYHDYDYVNTSLSRAREHVHVYTHMVTQQRM